jgi:hypothetical protein
MGQVGFLRAHGAGRRGLLIVIQLGLFHVTLTPRLYKEGRGTLVRHLSIPHLGHNDLGVTHSCA